MALTVDLSFKGISVFGAYAVVMLPQISADKESIGFGVWFRSSESESEHFHAVTYNAPYSLSGGDPFEQAYCHLKTLPEFADATDC